MSDKETHFNADAQALVGVDGKTIPLRPQTSDVLRLLVKKSGQLVTKNEIIENVWGEQIASDDSIYQCITEIRRALKKVGDTKVRTISRKGYVLDGLREQSNSSISLQPFTISDPEPIHYVNSVDGTRIAWSASGNGTHILKTPNWITHLGAERRSKIYGPFYDRLGKKARIVRYDQRGNGMSSWFVPPLTLDAMCEDILAVADAAEVQRFFLLGLSQGVPFAIEFAARYPERVIGIIGRGGYALGDLAGGNELNRQSYEASVKLIEVGWDSTDPTYRRYFTSRLAPDASPEMARGLDELQRLSVPKENLLNFFEFDAHLDVTHAAAQVNCPVLLVHSIGDRMVPFADGEHLASKLSNCKFVPLNGDNHALVPGTDGFDQGMLAMEGFVDQHSE